MARGRKNILFIMCDQLRWDYLSCDGHPQSRPHRTSMRWRRKGVRFTRAYVQSPVCGASRMSFYTGRYVQSHGATWNGVPLKVGEMTLGDYLRPLGMRTALVGKTHMRADSEGMAAPRHRSGFDHRRARGRMRLRPLRARRRAARRRPRRALRSAAAALQPLSQRQGLCRRQSLARLGQCRAKARATRSPPAGPCAMRASPRACARRTPRRPT